MDAHKNFAWSTVATAPSPATSGTSLVVASGEGANFPAVPFYAVVCPAGTQPTNANAEIIRVTARSTDTLSTITRAQLGTSARTIVAGDQIFQPFLAHEADGVFDRQVFTATGAGTWTKPAGVRRVRVVLIGGGGGGGSAARGAAGTIRCGGGGGAGGAAVECWFAADDLGPTVALTVGIGGPGGAGAAADGVGTTGTAGGISNFGALIYAYPGNPGFAGSTTSGPGGNVVGATTDLGCPAGASASTAGGAGNQSNFAKGLGPWSTAGGGSGGGLTAAPVEAAGGAGRDNTVATNGVCQVGGTVGGGSATQVASPISLATMLYAANPVYSGAGGGAAASAAGGTGGTAQGYGGGGGGGGASGSGFLSGAGGAGAPGLIIVESWS